jgi:hypothetical protein
MKKIDTNAASIPPRARSTVSYRDNTSNTPFLLIPRGKEDGSASG